jgi:hypothetical protein
MARREKGQEFKLRHSKYSGMRIADAREALAIVHTMSEEFTRELDRLTKWKVTDKVFDNLLDLAVPIPDETENKRGHTVAEKKREQILNLYRSDERAAPWKGTAFGVLQAFNTYNHHFTQVRMDAPSISRIIVYVLSEKFTEAVADILY